jgi:hypothetical protein
MNMNMNTAQFSSSYRNQDTVLDIWQQGLHREPGCCAGTAGLVSGGVERCVCVWGGGGKGISAIICIYYSTLYYIMFICILTITI